MSTSNILIWGSQRPIIPFSLGLQRVSQATSAHLLSFLSPPPHKNVCYNILIFLRNFMGVARIEKRYKGRAKMMKLTKRTRPRREIK